MRFGRLALLQSNRAGISFDNGDTNGGAIAIASASGARVVGVAVRIGPPKGAVVASAGFVVGIGTCRRAKPYPLCYPSHRRRRRTDPDSADRST